MPLLWVLASPSELGVDSLHESYESGGGLRLKTHASSLKLCWRTITSSVVFLFFSSPRSVSWPHEVMKAQYYWSCDITSSNSLPEAFTPPFLPFFLFCAGTAFGLVKLRQKNPHHWKVPLKPLKSIPLKSMRIQWWPLISMERGTIDFNGLFHWFQRCFNGFLEFSLRGLSSTLGLSFCFLVMQWPRQKTTLQICACAYRVSQTNSQKKDGLFQKKRTKGVVSMINNKHSIIVQPKTILRITTKSTSSPWWGSSINPHGTQRATSYQLRQTLAHSPRTTNAQIASAEGTTINAHRSWMKWNRSLWPTNCYGMESAYDVCNLQTAINTVAQVYTVKNV